MHSPGIEHQATGIQLQIGRISRNLFTIITLFTRLIFNVVKDFLR